MSLASDVHFFRSFSHAELEQSMADLALPDELNASLLAYLTQRKDMISLLPGLMMRAIRTIRARLISCVANLSPAWQ